jgi:hypothetical protein
MYDGVALITNHRCAVETLKETLPEIKEKILIVDTRDSLDCDAIREKHLYIGIGKPLEVQK